MIKIRLSWCWIMLFSPVLFAQTWQNYTTENSILTTNTIKAVCQDGLGFKWFGTPDGLFGFNGTTWTKYQKDPTAKQTLADNHVNDIVYEFTSYGHEIWVATDNGISVIAINALDALTFATPYRQENDNVTLTSNKITAAAVDERHTKWFGSDQGITSFSGSDWHTYQDKDYFDLYNDMINAIATAFDTIYCATEGGGVSRLRYELDVITTASPIDTWNFIASDSVYTVFIDSKGAKWFGTNHGVSRFLGQDIRIFPAWITYTTDSVFTCVVRNGVPYDSAYAIAGGGLADNFVQTICEDSNGVIWFGTRTGLTRFDGTVWKTFTTSDGLAGDIVYDLTVDANNALWIATNGGVSHYSNEPATVHSPTEAPVPAFNTVKNYPNPFNLQTTIEFTLRERTETTITIFNTRGQSVRQWFNKTLPAGKNRIQWNGTDEKGRLLASGIYLVRVNTASRGMTGKLVLTK